MIPGFSLSSLHTLGGQGLTVELAAGVEVGEPDDDELCATAISLATRGD